MRTKLNIYIFIDTLNYQSMIEIMKHNQIN